MLKIDQAIALNKYGQGLIVSEILADEFSGFNLIEKRNYLNQIIALILQSKPKEEDINPAIINSGLKPTFTPCILLKKGVENHNLKRLITLPESELKKAFILLLSLFKIAYQRRFEEEKNVDDKWWYWDLSDESKIEIIKNHFR